WTNFQDVTQIADARNTASLLAVGRDPAQDKTLGGSSTSLTPLPSSSPTQYHPIRAGAAWPCSGAHQRTPQSSNRDSPASRATITYRSFLIAGASLFHLSLAHYSFSTLFC